MERNAFVLDHQHGRRDVTCKPAIVNHFVSFWKEKLKIEIKSGLIKGIEILKNRFFC